MRRNRTANRNYPLLVELSNKYNKTQNQVILNWIVKEKGLNVLIKSTNIERINENFEAIKMEKELTVRINCNFEELDKDLLNKGFKKVEEYEVNDTYLIKDDVDIFNTPILN